jgi:DNA-binding NarL/FixJ family response regulator
LPAITIAAVDDHPIVRRGLVGSLGSMPDSRVLATASSLSELLAGPGREADVVLLDLDLGDGSELHDNIRRLLAADIAVVVFSPVAEPRTVRAAMRAGASSYVSKTDDIDDLARAIRAAAAGTGWISPQLAFLLLTDDAPDRPTLSAKEREALRLYAAGMPLKTVARRMNVATETAKQYIDRVRRKYREAGREAETKVDIYRRAIEDAHLDP